MSHPTPKDMARQKAAREALRKLADIYSKYLANELDEEARRKWGRDLENENTTPPEQIILYTGRGGATLLTLADCKAAYEALMETSNPTPAPKSDAVGVVSDREWIDSLNRIMEAENNHLRRLLAFAHFIYCVDRKLKGGGDGSGPVMDYAHDSADVIEKKMKQNGLLAPDLTEGSKKEGE